MNKRPLWKRLVRLGIFGIVAILTIAVLALSWISFQGRREWAQTKADLLARGEKLSLVELAPPPIPDDRNFYADPLWQQTPQPDGGDGPRTFPIKRLDAPPNEEEWSRLRAILPDKTTARPDSRTLLARQLATLSHTGGAAWQTAEAQAALALLAPFTPLLKSIDALLEQRPEGYPLMDYANPYRLSDFYSELGSVNIVLDALAARAEAGLELGDSGAAAHDVMDLFKLADTLRTEPLLYPQMMRMPCLSAAIGTTNLGISRHAWSAAELLAFQGAMESIELLPDFALAFRGERGLRNQVFENQDGLSLYKVLLPGDRAAENRLVQELVERLDAAPAKGLDKGALRDLADRAIHWMHPLTYRFFYFYGDQATIIAMLQNELRQTAMACALERYRLAHGNYPEKLSDIVPEYLKAPPLDAFTLRPMRYARTPEAFTLSDGDDVSWAIESPPSSSQTPMRPQVRRIIRPPGETK